MENLTEEQRKAIDRIQADQDQDVTVEDRKRFMQRILTTPRSAVESAPKPATAKRGRPSKRPSAHGVA